MTALGPEVVKAFLGSVLPWGAGHSQLHWCWRENGKLRWGGRAVSSVDEMIKVAAAASPSRDVYFCTSAQKEDKPPYPHGAPIRSRANAVSLKSLYADLDVKEGAYASVDDAVWAVAHFCKKVGMPIPDAWVKSGGGLHVYWITPTAKPLNEWQPYADGLKHCLQEYGIKADYGCTSNAAQLLRVPGTFNHKTNPPKLVELIAYHA